MRLSSAFVHQHSLVSHHCPTAYNNERRQRRVILREFSIDKLPESDPWIKTYPMDGYLSSAVEDILTGPGCITLSGETLFQLSAILMVHRIYRTRRPTYCLGLQNLGRIVNTLLHQELIQYYEPKAIILLERHLGVVAEGLFSLSEERFTLAHVQAVSWYKAIGELFVVYERLVADKMTGLEIEQWNVAFHHVHCQSLFLRIKDHYSSAERLSEKTEQIFDAALYMYTGEYVGGKETVKSLFQFQRPRAPWHEDYLAFERLSFNIICAALMSERNVTVSEMAKKAISSLRDRVGQELAKRTKSELSEKLKKAVAEVSRHVTRMGAYRKNSDYFNLGLLELNYKLSFYVSAREECFREMVGAVFTVLDRPSSKYLHNKVIDIYSAISLFAKSDDRRYGDLKDQNSIEDWLEESKYSSETYKKSSSEYVPGRDSSDRDRRFERTRVATEQLSERVKTLLERSATPQTFKLIIDFKSEPSNANRNTGNPPKTPDLQVETELSQNNERKMEFPAAIPTRSTESSSWKQLLFGGKKSRKNSQSTFNSIPATPKLDGTHNSRSVALR